jgi:hypothetical protein
VALLQTNRLKLTGSLCPRRTRSSGISRRRNEAYLRFCDPRLAEISPERAYFRRTTRRQRTFLRALPNKPALKKFRDCQGKYIKTLRARSTICLLKFSDNASGTVTVNHDIASRYTDPGRRGSECEDRAGEFSPFNLWINLLINRIPFNAHPVLSELRY